MHKTTLSLDRQLSVTLGKIAKAEGRSKHKQIEEFVKEYQKAQKLEKEREVAA